MNAKKISQFVVISACILGFFAFGSSAFAYLANYSAYTLHPSTIITSGGGHYLCGTEHILYSSLQAPPNNINWNAQDFKGDANYNISGYGAGTGNSGGDRYLDSQFDACDDLSYYYNNPSYYTGWIYFPRNVNDDNNYGARIIFKAYITGGVATPENPVPPVPHIATFTYSTTTATAHFTGYWEATTTPYTTQRLSFWQYSTSLGRESYEQVIATTTGAFDFSFTFNDPYSWTSGESSTTPIYSSFTLNASLDQYDETNYNFPFGGTIIDNIDATSTIISAAVYNASDFISTPRALALYPEYECGITSMMGCIKNAAIWLFYPTQDALDSWQSLKGTLETKAPVGYFYLVKNNIGGLSATSTAAFSLTIPKHLKTYIFDPFDIGLSGILWFFFIFHFYKRLKHITI